MSAKLDWNGFTSALCDIPALGFRLDPSLMDAPRVLAAVRPKWPEALAAMQELVAGAIANPDENRQVGHYWLRAPELAPDPDTAARIRDTGASVRSFAKRVLDGSLRPERGGRFTRLLVVGIGGSALGPQFLAHALADRERGLKPYFLDNTDPVGMDAVFAEIGAGLSETLVVVISKSGGTPETRNGLIETAEAYGRAGLDFGRHAVAVTGEGSALDREAAARGFLAAFPMWDWVGGRTSVFSAVGLLPAALMAVDVDAFLDGARRMDEATLHPSLEGNPAGLLAACWYAAGNGHGERSMVVLPYRDSLLLFSRYLQQLVMESVGKAKDLEGHVVHQGLTVYGNKGSTDQHAFVQQLRDGTNDFFVTFIHVQSGRRQPSPAVDDAGATSADYLLGFLLGTRTALAENGRPSLTLTLPDAGARSVGALIALYERAVGYYASLIGINAYHQPGVEAGKQAAARVLEMRVALLDALGTASGPCGVEELARKTGADPVLAFEILESLAARGGDAAGVVRTNPGSGARESLYSRG